MAEEGSDIIIGDDDGASDGAAFVYLPLYATDPGHFHGRPQRPEFVSRNPACVSDFDETGLTLEISNSGQVISDVVAVEYQIVFCTWANHGAQDGFTESHASESQSDLLEKYMNLDFVEPGSSVMRRIDFPNLGYLHLVKNVYFRARVSTLWSASVPVEQWDFARDVCVTEAHFRAGN